MNHLAVFIEHDKHGKSETATVVQALHQGFGLLLLFLTAGFLGIVVHVDILEVIGNDLADSAVVGDEVCKTQAPRTPVAPHLTDYLLALRLCLDERLVYLCQRVDVFVIHLFHTCLGIHCDSQ